MPWWRYRRGLPEFKGIKVTFADNGLADYPDILRVKIARDGKSFSGILSLDPGTIGSGGNSGFQALNLAVQWGAAKIVLIGFDMGGGGAGKPHWYGRNHWMGANNPDETNYSRWREALDATAPMLRQLGVEVLNASHVSRLRAFPKRDLKECI